MKKRLFLTFDVGDRNKPILSTLASTFDVSFNIMGATINDKQQCMALELEGSEEAIAAAMNFLDETGVRRDDG